MVARTCHLVAASHDNVWMEKLFKMAKSADLQIYTTLQYFGSKLLLMAQFSFETENLQAWII